MNSIDAYVNTLFKSIIVKNKEIKETKEEIRAYLFEAVNDLMLDGKSEKEAIQIALERFGDTDDIMKGFLIFFQRQMRFLKILFYTALICLLLSIPYRVTVNHFYTAYALEKKQLLESILVVANNDNTLTSKETNQIEKELLQGYKHKDDLQYLAIFHKDNGFSNSTNLSGKMDVNEAVYKSPSSSARINTGSIDGSSQDHWYVEAQTKFNYDQYFMNWNQVSNGLIIVAASLFAVWFILRIKYTTQMRKIQGNR